MRLDRAMDFYTAVVATIFGIIAFVEHDVFWLVATWMLLWLLTTTRRKDT